MMFVCLPTACTDCFTNYPNQPFQDDNFLTKPDTLYDHLYFHDLVTSGVYSSQEWELAPYLSQAVCAFHHLFASPSASHAKAAQSYRNKNEAETANDEEDAVPFTGPRASHSVYEATAANKSHLQSLQSSLGTSLQRTYNSPAALSTELLPYLLRMLNPCINPVVIRGATTSTGNKWATPSSATVRKAREREMVSLSVNAMLASGISFGRVRIEDGAETFSAAGARTTTTGYVYRMEPALDEVGRYPTGKELRRRRRGRTGQIRRSAGARHGVDERASQKRGGDEES